MYYMNYNISIRHISFKNKANPYQYILDQKAKLITFFIGPRGTLENIFKVESLAQLHFWG